jgi:hypothetical protein
MDIMIYMRRLVRVDQEEWVIDGHPVVVDVVKLRCGEGNMAAKCAECATYQGTASSRCPWPEPLQNGGESEGRK